MSQVHERELVHAALPYADHLLAAFVAANPAPSGNGARVLLHAGNIDEAAIVTLVRKHHPGDMTPRYDVHWKAETGSAFPVFSGELVVEADEDYNSFWLTIDGSYEPPGGLAGKMFDAVVGHRLALDTTHNLLLAMRDTAEAEYTRDEQSKPHVATTPDSDAID
jgi:hypothetical protein